MAEVHKVYYMYVLACADDTLYTGYTSNLERREKEHQAGIGAKYTRPEFRRPCQMIFSQAYSTRSQAMSAEYHFKQLSRQEKEKQLKKYGVTHFEVGPETHRIDRPLSS